MNKVITVLISLTTATAMLLFSIAALLIWAPEFLLDYFYIWIIAACIIGGVYLLIPLVFVILGAVSWLWNKRRKKKHAKDGN